MNKFKTLKVGRYYISRKGDFAIGLLGGSKKKGYNFVASYVQPTMWLGMIQTLSRVVPNDGSFLEIDRKMFEAASALHFKGLLLRVPHENKSHREPLQYRRY